MALYNKIVSWRSRLVTWTEFSQENVFQSTKMTLCPELSTSWTWRASYTLKKMPAWKTSFCNRSPRATLTTPCFGWRQRRGVNFCCFCFGPSWYLYVGWISSITCFLFTNNQVGGNWTGPVWTLWTQEFNCSFMKLNNGSAIGFLFLEFGCVMVQPTAMKFDRRFAYLASTLVSIVACISTLCGIVLCGESDWRICWCSCRLSRGNLHDRHVFSTRKGVICWLVCLVFVRRLRFGSRGVWLYHWDHGLEMVLLLSRYILWRVARSAIVRHGGYKLWASRSQWSHGGRCTRADQEPSDGRHSNQKRIASTWGGREADEGNTWSCQCKFLQRLR